MLLNPAKRQMLVIFHPDLVPGASTFLPAQISSRPYSGSPIAAISTRLNIDGHPGVIALHSGQTVPSVMMPLPDPTAFTPRSVTPIAKPASTALTILTTGGHSVLAGNFSGRGRATMFALLFPVAGLLFGFRRRKWKGGAKSLAFAGLLLVCTGLALAGCASRSSLQSAGTPPGTYPLTVTATSGSVERTTTVTLVVKP